jgi:hypothetical protein
MNWRESSRKSWIITVSRGSTQIFLKQITLGGTGDRDDSPLAREQQRECDLGRGRALAHLGGNARKAVSEVRAVELGRDDNLVPERL